jgi:uncharacterized membrane protein YoaK (UPF0700 family)
MQSQELLEHRVNEAEYTLHLVTDNLRSLQNNLETMLEQSNKLVTRINVLEKDLEERKIRKYIFNLLMFFYPVLLGGMLFMTTIDHSKVLLVLDDIENLIGYSAGDV